MIRISLPIKTAVAVVAVFAPALVVAAVVKRAPPNFAEAPIAVVQDATKRPLWTLRLAPAAHEIAVDALAPGSSAPAGSAFQLWLQTPSGPRSLGLLPDAGRTVIPEMPAMIDRLSGGAGELVVTREAKGGSRQSTPMGPVIFRATLGG